MGSNSISRYGRHDFLIAAYVRMAASAIHAIGKQERTLVHVRARRHHVSLRYSTGRSASSVMMSTSSGSNSSKDLRRIDSGCSAPHQAVVDPHVSGVCCD